eukprot:TRINITY_DN3976_c4_g1_i1.p1 TRINITY_DN3976_c4_g1~~TRINITY_DN3976_c4_g1_i1.p1  ORF type:complete len:646 (+),score=144.18 TRINITY_DN3976_c4_g1_i1:361-2298(+)
MCWAFDLNAFPTQSPDLQNRLRNQEEEIRIIRKEWLSEKNMREKVESDLKELLKNKLGTSRSIKETAGRHNREVSELKKELEKIDDYLAAEGLDRGGDRIEALRGLRDDEIKILDASNRGREQAMESCTASANELKRLQSELIWLRRSPFIICSLRPECDSRDRAPHHMGCSIIDVSPDMPSQRIEIRLPSKSQAYRFDNVLPPWSSSSDIASSVGDVVAAAFSGIYTGLLCVGSDSLVAASRTSPTIQAVAKEVFAAAERSSSLDAWEWKVQFSCIELRSDTTRDLLNTDRDYIRNQKMGGSIAIKHSIKKEKGHVVCTDCAMPSVKDTSTMLKLLEVAIGNRCVSPEGELRGHVVFVFNIFGSKHRNTFVSKGSLVVVDLATDSELPVELPAGTDTDNAIAVQASMEERTREREYVKKSLGHLNLMLDKLQGSNKISAEDERRCPSASPVRNVRQPEFTIGQDVEITGLHAADFIHLNGTHGVVMGKGVGDVADRVLVEFASDYTLPFLPKNLMPLGRQASPSPGVSPHRVTFAETPPKRHHSTSHESKRSTRSKSPAHSLAADTPRTSLPKSKLNAILSPCFEGGIFGVILSLPVQTGEATGMASLRLCAKISKCQMGQLQSNPAGTEKLRQAPQQSNLVTL